MSRNDTPLVLVVDDEPAQRALLSYNLEAAGFRVATASDGEEALLLVAEESPDVILLDWMLPRVSGIEVCRQLKAQRGAQDAAIIMVSARSDESDRVRGLETGADDYITKPFNMHLLALRVRNLIESRKKLREKFGRSFDLNPTAENLNTLDKEFLERIRAEVESHLEDEHFSVDQLAATLCMSRMHLYRKLKALSGQSPNKVIRSIRLKKAAQLLLSGQYNVSEVTYMVGYNDLKSFREQFKKEFGVSPSDYNGD